MIMTTLEPYPRGMDTLPIVSPLGQRNICASESGGQLIWISKHQYLLLAIKGLLLPNAIPVSQF